MQIVQVLLPDAGFYHRKCQLLDYDQLQRTHPIAALTTSDEHEVSTYLANADPTDFVVHIYGDSAHDWRVDALTFSNLPQPPAINSVIKAASPLGDPAVTEPVDPAYFEFVRTATLKDKLVVGSLHRTAADLDFCERAYARISRFREDIDWNVFETPPSVDELREIDLWADPAMGGDPNGFVCEAMAAGIPVVAAETPLNTWRTEAGASGTLVKVNDPNLFVHALLELLFKPEIADPKIQAAKERAESFRAELRAADLLRLYSSTRP